MTNKDRRKPNRIPVRFVGEEGAEGPEAGNDSGKTPDELGRESSYDDSTEMGQRVEEGAGQETSGPDPSELPRSRGDQDTTVSHTDDAEKSSTGGASASSEEPARQTASGPVMAELVATRAELRRVEGELKKFADERADLMDKLARRQADFDNFRKRTERERAETYNRALGEVVRRLLPVMDNLQRALETERTMEAKESAEFKHFLEGVELINRQLGGVVEGLGVEVIPTVGHLFDPHVHEAVTTEERADVEPDTIVQEMQRGYRLGDKLLRPAMVKVATKG